jgi:serine/threonine-protein kinase HipA
MKKRFAYVHMFLGSGYTPTGMIEIVEDGAYSTCKFRYFDGYPERKDAVAVDPVRLPLDDAVKRVFDGPRGGDLFGGIEDACPDSWGRHLLDTAASDAGQTLQPYDYMLYAGRERIGALGFSAKKVHEPSGYIPSWLRNIPGSELNLEEMLVAADKVEAAENLELQYRRFFVRGSSLGGARPKSAFDYEGGAWIAKFGAAKEVLPTCRLEHATLALAGLCGIQTPQTQRVTVFGDRDILLVKRFDRKENARIPFVSALTLLGKSRSEADTPASYMDIAEAMRRHCLGSSLKENLAELFSRMVFNICCHNNDDHLRNHGFLHVEAPKRGWVLSPAYDVVPQPYDHETGHLHLGVGAQGRRATFENAVSASAQFGLSREDASNIILKIKDIVSANWEKVMLDSGVPTRLLPLVRKSFGTVFEDAATQASDVGTQRKKNVIP